MGSGSIGRVAGKRRRQRKKKERERREKHAERQKAAGYTHDQRPGTRPNLGKVVGPAKAGPEGMTRRGEEDANPWKKKTDTELLLELSKALDRWRRGHENIGYRDQAMRILDALRDVDFAIRKKTALMRCAEKGFLPGVRYLVLERGANTRLEGRLGTALDYAYVVQGRGCRYVDDVIDYFERVEKVRAWRGC